jgi:hypothetical protein
MDGGNIQSPVFAEKPDPLCLKEMGTDCIYSYGIGSNDQSFVRPNVSPVEKIGSPSKELGREATEDIQAGLSLYDGVSPNFSQR